MAKSPGVSLCDTTLAAIAKDRGRTNKPVKADIMKTRIQLLATLVLLFAIKVLNKNEHLAAVVPVDPEQEFIESIKTPLPGKPPKSAIPEPVAIPDIPSTKLSKKETVYVEGRRAQASRAKKVFSAAQFICSLPIEAGTCTTVCNAVSEATAMVRKLKEEGYSMIRLTGAHNGEVYNAILKSAREQDMRVDA